jgi:hypothetical protein
MNAFDILKYGHLTVLGTIENLPESEWETPNVCGIWSSKQIIAHLASFEYMLEDVFNTFLGEDFGPTLRSYSRLGLSFNDVEVAKRQDMTAAEVLEEYTDRHTRNQEILKDFPTELLPKVGTMPWYGNEYCLDDFLVYSFYGHKREHTSQINVFKDTLGL